MTTATAKEEARRLIDRLPDDATWDELEYELYVRRAVDAGIADSNAGRVVGIEELRQSIGLSS